MPNPTVHPAESFNAKEDAEALHKAMKGLGTNEKAIINILCQRSSSQRQEIVHAFKGSYGKDLSSKLKSELSGNFERLILALITPLPEYLAAELHDAMAGIGTKEKVLVEILCTRTNDEMRKISHAYQKLYGQSIDKDVKGDTSGEFKKLLLKLLKAERDESDQVDIEAALLDAKKLYHAGEGRLGTDEETFFTIMTSRSYGHINRIRLEYETLRGHSLKKAIKSEFSGITKTALFAILQCAVNKPKYFANRLNKSMVGMGTRDGDLIRVIVSRCEIDLANIRIEYEDHFKKPLSKAVASETSGDYKQALLSLIG